ncbi:winged helix-turn-helix transcriptional regulator [Nocardioides sp. CCNWLW239]|uniref:winged helix-turn-helix transcriptional regulator n=1 Tax=Nocardioides sp. CCNWLW239 TaxID=3128902 RepID=UPI003017D50E
MRREDLSDADCGIAQALGVIGDWQSLLVVREAAAGVTRFEGFHRALGLSRRALAERLAALVADGVLAKIAYSERPPRHDYRLTARGEALLPVLVALQEWGTQHLLGDGELTGDPLGAELQRVHALVGTRVPELALTAHDGSEVSLWVPGEWTVVFAFPGAYAPESHGYPPGWSDIPGTRGCTLECRTYAARHDDLGGGRVLGVSTQRPDQLAAFHEWADLPYPLLSDADGRAASALRLPVFRAGGSDRLKRTTLLVDPEGIVAHVQAPVTDPAGSVDEMVEVVARARRGG